MPVHDPFPELDELLASMGEAGSRISDVDASEAGLVLRAHEVALWGQHGVMARSGDSATRAVDSPWVRR